MDRAIVEFKKGQIVGIIEFYKNYKQDHVIVKFDLKSKLKNILRMSVNHNFLTNIRFKEGAFKQTVKTNSINFDNIIGKKIQFHVYKDIPFWEYICYDNKPKVGDQLLIGKIDLISSTI